MGTDPKVPLLLLGCPEPEGLRRDARRTHVNVAVRICESALLRPQLSLIAT